ncbi:1-aminocyclopropane-1-carboxylate synthase-like protein 1 [Latimeria chalumnae]|uniref:1-aminocyclopropane-1-carboxylate synthase-like protein 1 n=1 Tax=Latimeria chalumnae TaxID=7897 RepID=UPI0003C17134|nr:PREDICTED: 1-aminocyclopropane-1-carboxylate synthase-like protein 1 [Latimeria chalumnae]|eukprot:XP_005986972.1 PREDICTED: 1-aminocyclopropane-1-carboxylate synthase-like protein 1 [Latimeria chalumnae]
MDFRGKKYERGSNWSDPEVVELLQLWADESVQIELESCLRNQHVFNRIAEVLREKGIHRTGDQCREKIKKMKLEYRRIKDNQKTLRGGRTWKFFEVMDRVLTNRPSISYSALGGTVIAQQVLQGSGVDGYHQHHHFVPSVHAFAHAHHPELMEIKCEEVESDEPCITPEPPPSMTYQPGSLEEHELDRSLLERGHNESPVPRADMPVEPSISPSAYSEQNVAASSSRVQSQTPRPGLSSLQRLRKKRKAQRLKDPLDDILLKFLTSQRAVEERFLQMEERRMQRDTEMEERRMELEQRRMELEREHEFRMFAIFAQMLSALKPGSGGGGQSPGLDFSQAYSQFADLGGVATGSTTGGQDNKVLQSKAALHKLLCTFDKPNGNPYLSQRGNDIMNFTGTLEEGFAAYTVDKHDEDKNPNGIINLGTSENKLCFDLLSKRLTQNDMYQIDPPLLQYPDWKGHMFLREEVARFLTYYCKAPTPLKPENVVVVNGCGSLFSALATVLCDPGDAILIPTPFYGVIASDVFHYSKAKLVFAHLESQVTGSDSRPFQLTVEKLERALQEAKFEGRRVKALILINPHNPLGDIYSLSEMKGYLEFAKRHELHVIVDEVYMLSVFDETATFQSVLSFDELPDPQRTHVMWGISKDFAASGIRVGTLYLENQDVLRALGRLAYFHGVPGPMQYKVAQLLRDRDWINQVFLQTNRARLKQAHKYVTNELTALGIPYLNRSAGLYVWADFRKCLKRNTFEEELKLWRRFLENKVLLSCGKGFECQEPGWFRLIFADKTYRLQLGMQRLGKVLQELVQELQLEEQKQGSQSGAEGVEEKMQVTAVQQDVAGAGLDGLIGLLRQQIRSSDWLQKNTVEQFAQENPEVYDVFSKLAEKQ